MTNRALAPAFLAPYVAYVAIAALPLERAWSYSIRIAAVGALLLWARPRYLRLRGPGSPLVSMAVGAAAGLVGLILWIALLQPFVQKGAEPWTGTAFWLRLLAAGLLVPLFEEQLMRGYLLRLVLQWREAKDFDEAFERRSVADVAPGAASLLAVAASSVLFALGHGVAEMAAAAAYGLLMAALWVVRKDLLSCVVAHAVTNIALALYVRANGAWHLW